MMKRRIFAALFFSLGLIGTAPVHAQDKVAMLRPTEDLVAKAPSGYDLGAWSEFNQGYQAYMENDFDDSMRLFQYAAYDGSRDAQEFLALMYLGGEKTYPNVKRSRENAVAWLETAAKRGSKVAAQTLDILRQGNDDYARYYLGAVLMP